MKNKKGIISLVILGIVILSLCALLVYRLFFYNNTHSVQNNVKTLEQIKGYGIVLEDRDTKLYTESYKELKTILSTDSIDYEAYASNLAKLYIIDFYTLSNKLNKYDVGALDFILDSDKDAFKNKAMDTYYRYVKDNTYGDRTQNLPEVKALEITSIEDMSYKIENKTYDAYLVKVEWSYTTDVDAPTEIDLTIANIDDKLYIVKIGE